MDRSEYLNTRQLVNYLQSNILASCTISVMGPSGFYPESWDTVELGTVKYNVYKTLNEKDNVSIFYYENQSIIGFSYDKIGIPILIVRSNRLEASRCRENAEHVLGTLRMPE